jgi:outer membrane biosynthesis protein TonB
LQWNSKEKMIRSARFFSTGVFGISLRLKRRLRRQQEGFIQMINTLTPATAWCASIAAVLFAAAMPALAQAPTDAQRSAIRSECRADYQAHCASIQPGGMASLQCLQQNMSSLSPGCQSAVRAVEAPATAPKAEQAPPPAAPAAAAKAEQAPSSIAPAAKPVTEPATETAAPPIPAAKAAAASAPAQKPSNSQITAIRSACRSDYQRNCVGVPTGGAATLQCLEKNKAHLSASCQKAVNAAGGGAPAPAASAAPAAAAPAGSGAAPAAAAPALALRPMRPREMLFVLRSACGADARSLCGDVSAGGGRIIQCLAAQAASLSPACADVLGQFAAQ